MEKISQTKMRVALEAAKKVIKGNYQDAPDEYEIEQAVLTQIDDALKEGMVKDAVGPLVYIKVQNALKELGRFEEWEIPWTRAAPLIDVLQVAQSYLLTSPQGADRKILDEINDAITKPQKPQELKATLEAILLYLNKPHLEMKCKYCGCTDDHACEGGCSWVAKDVCSKCAASLVVVYKMDGGALRGALRGALLRTVGNPKSPQPTNCSIPSNNLFDHRIKEIFVPLEAMIFTAENLLNTYQEITGEKIRLKLGAKENV